MLSIKQTITARSCAGLMFYFAMFSATASALDGPRCTGSLVGVPCWMELTGKAECHVWDDEGHHETVTWSGSCAGGLAAGRGWLVHTHYGDKSNHEEAGTLIDGKKNGHWIERYAKGFVFEGPYRDGVKHGPWVLRSPDGSVGAEGRFVTGKRHGRWIERGPLMLGRIKLDRSFVNEGPYVNGRKHGRWTEKRSGGFVANGLYANGKKNGYWIERWPKGSVHKGSYMGGKKYGRWIERTSGGYVDAGSYLEGKKYGRWIRRQPDGSPAKTKIILAFQLCTGEERNVPQFDALYRKGKRHGYWKLCDIEGLLQEEGSYVDGNRHENWKFYDFDGRLKKEGPYVHGKKHGLWVERRRGGTVLEGPYVHGKKHGSWIVRREDNSIVLEGTFEHDKIHGRWVVISPDETSFRVCWNDGVWSSEDDKC